MRRAFGAMLLVAAALAQVTWAPRLEVGGAFPNLVLLAVVAVTWTLGARSGFVWACVGGVLLDLTAPGSNYYDRLNQLVPAPVTVPRDAVRSWTPSVTEPWWPPVLQASGVSAIKKKKGMLRGL